MPEPHAYPEPEPVEVPHEEALPEPFHEQALHSVPETYFVPRGRTADRPDTKPNRAGVLRPCPNGVPDRLPHGSAVRTAARFTRWDEPRLAGRSW